MEIPKSMQSLWSEVSKDNKITKQEYSQLLEAAAPNKKNEEFDKEEVNFLGTIKKEISTKGFVEGNIPDEYKSQNPIKNKNNSSSTIPVSFVDDNQDKPIKTTEVPKSMKSVWAEVSKDNKITKQEYSQLLEAAAPNKKNEEFDKGEIKFLGSIKKGIDTKGSVEGNIPNEYKSQNPIKNNSTSPAPVTFVDENEETSVKPTEKAQNTPAVQTTNTGKDLPPIPEKLKSKWEELSKDGEINSNDYQNLLLTAAPKSDVSSLKREDINFLLAVKRKVVEGNGAFKVPSKTETPISNSGEVPETLKETWKKVSADGKITKDDYKELIKAVAPNGKDEEVDESEMKFLSSLKEKLSGEESINTSTQSTPTDNKTKVPPTLETIWNEVSKDRVLDIKDLKALINAAKPTGKDEELDAEENKFLGDLTSKMIQADGTLAL